MRNDLLSKLKTGSITTWEEFSSDPDFVELRKRVNPEFEKTFTLAYNAYIRGDWHTSGTHLENLIQQQPNDGPTKGLYRTVVTKHNKKKPDNW